MVYIKFLYEYGDSFECFQVHARKELSSAGISAGSCV